MGAPEHPASSASREPIAVEFNPTRVSGYAAIVTLCGEHDIATAPGIQVSLAPIYGNVLVDLSSCDFLDSTVITALLAKREDLRREGHEIALVVPLENVTVQRIVEITGLRTIVTVHDRMPVEAAERGDAA